jgi:hypothetical protein
MTIWRKLVLLGLLGAGVAQAAPKELPTPPPPPMPQVQNVTMFRGRTVEIPLRAIGRAPSQLKFLIRTKPKSGRLGEIQFTSRKTAVVTYYHDEKSSAAYDSFTYAVQAVDTAVSAPGVVHIAISEEPPALSVIHTLDFGQVWMGEKRTEEIVIRNTGGGSLAGRMIVSEPWKILGSPEYRLGRREEKKVRLQFAPADPGEFTARLLFSHDPRSSVTLSGGAEAPLEFEPEREVELTAAFGTSVRLGRLTLRNRTAADRLVEISLPEQVLGSEEVTVPAEGELNLDLRTKADFLGALEDRIDLQSEGFQRSLTLRVFAVPPLLRYEPANGLDFGTVGVKSPVRRPLTLRNEGGSPVRLRMEAPQEARVIPDPNSVVLAPGEKRNFEVECEVMKDGPFQGEITLGSDGSPERQKIPVRARGIAAPAQPEAPTPPGAGVRSEVADVLPRTPGGSSTPETFSEIPAVGKITTTALSRKAIEFRWKKPAPNAVSSLIEFRSVEKDGSGRPVTRWNKWQGAAMREEGGETIAVLGNLPPGGTWYLRVLTLDETGRRSRPSEIVRLTTPNAPQVYWIWWLAGLAVAGLVGYVVMLVRRRREAEAQADADRLSKIHT